MSSPRKLAVVTGGIRGIGLAIARRLTGEGYRVVVGDLDADMGVSDVAAAWPLDVADPASVNAFFARVQADFGPLHALVCNAGTYRHGPTVTMSDDDWRTVIDTNLSGGFYCARAARPLLSDDGTASVVFISSMNGQQGWPGRANYGSSKAGLIGLTRALAIEWAPNGIRVNAVAPGYVATRMLLERIENKTINPADLLARIPLGRFAGEDDVAGVVRFMLSSEAAYITGQTLNVDGGWTTYGGK